VPLRRAGEGFERDRRGGAKSGKAAVLKRKERMGEKKRGGAGGHHELHNGKREIGAPTV